MKRRTAKGSRRGNDNRNVSIGPRGCRRAKIMGKLIDNNGEVLRFKTPRASADFDSFLLASLFFPIFHVHILDQLEKY